MKVKLIHYVVLACIFLLSSSLAFAQDSEVVGRAVTRQDWVNFMPVFVGAILVVIIVDAFFLVPIFRKNDNPQKDEA
ncbi:MAG: hypothetical protein WBC91_26950 [Phototrophicaceae bacterium]